MDDRRFGEKGSARGGQVKTRICLILFYVLILGSSLWPGDSGALTTSDKLKQIASLEDLRAASSAIATFLVDEDPVVRSRAAVALGRIQDTTSVRWLLPLVKDASADVRSSAAFALGQIGSLPTSPTGPSSEALVKLLTDPSPDAKIAAAEALGKIKSRQAVRQLSRLLGASDKPLAQQAALSLAFIRDSTALPALWEAASSRDEELRWRVVYALENMPHTKSVKVISGLARDKSWLVRSFAARALAKIDDESCLSILAQFLRDQDWHVRVNAARSLGSFKKEESISSLVSALGDEAFHVRATACAALGRIGSEKATNFLRILLADRSPTVRAEAARAFLLCGKGSTPQFTESILEDEVWFVRASAYEALGEAEIPNAVSILHQAYTREKDRRARASCVVGMGKAKSDTALPFLQEAAADTDMVVVACVCEALGEIGSPRAAGLVREIYEKWRDYPEPDVRLAAIETLKKLGAVGALQIYRESLFDRDYRVRDAAYGALKELWGYSPAESLRTLSLLAFPAPTEVPQGYEVVTSSYAGKAVIRTEKGNIVIRLLGEEAPNTVENFLKLVGRGFYDGFTFHRVVPNFVIQDGCPRGDGWGGPGYTIRCEINRRHYLSGTVGMALSGKDTGGSQFFITHSPQPHLDGKYTVFGEVVSGMDVVDRIERGDKIIAIELATEQ
jgi:HEAT repeat protein/cyclophilin family peptidyl-prolyl cis-trans isomerase